MAERVKKWGTVNESELREKDQQEKGKPWRAPGDKISYIKQGVCKAYVPKEGKNRIRIIQCLEAGNIGFYGMEVHFHRNLGPDEGDYLCRRRMYHVLRKAYGGDYSGLLDSNCPECEKQTNELWETNRDLAKTYYPTRRMWFLVNDVLSDNPDEVLRWSCPWTLHEEILARSHQEESQVYINIADPLNGVPISFERTGMGLMTKYTNVQVFTSPMPLPDDILDRMPWMDEMLIIPSYEEVRDAADGPVSTSHTTPSIGSSEQEKSPFREEPPECFRKEYGTYQDCDDGTCEWADECSKPEPESEPEKPRKPQKPSRPKREETPKAQSNNQEKKNAIAEKIKNAQRRRANGDGQ